MLDVAAVTAALLPRTGMIASLPLSWHLYLTALHDIGKVDPLFQNKALALARALAAQGLLLPEGTGSFRHEARTSRWVRQHLRAYGWEKDAAIAFAQMLHGHHGDFNSPLIRPPSNIHADDPEETPTRFKQWEDVRTRVAEELRAVLSIEAWRMEALPHASIAGIRFSGLVVLADWIASNAELFHYEALWKGQALPDYFAEAQREALRVVDRLQFGLQRCGDAEQSPLTFSALWPACPTLRPTQQTLATLCQTGHLPSPGLAIIEAPMGEGKTEAAIYLAEEWRRMSGRGGAYIALPTAATSNQMHARYTEFLKRWRPAHGGPRLVHGMAWLLDDMSPLKSDAMEIDEEQGIEQALDWFRPAKRALLASEAVGTVDQVLMAALHVKHGFLRLFGLAGKVLIIDEVHAYDAYMTTILTRLLAWCRALEIPVILLSATLAHEQKQRLAAAYAGADALPAPTSEGEPYPLLTFIPIDEAAQVHPVSATAAPQRVVQLQCHQGLLQDYRGIASLAEKTIADGGCACILANTVKDAQAIYRALTELSLPDTPLLLFHARFRAERRKELEEQVTRLFGKDAGPERPRRAILVATQVVEQSLDVDFDVMISQLAPVDLLLQRCGRLHRHARGERPTGAAATLHVLLPPAGVYEFHGTGAVYQQETLLRTLALLHGRDAFHLPTDFRPLIEGCYGDAQPPVSIDPAVFTEAVQRRERDQAEAATAARTHLIPEPSARVFSLADKKTRPVDEAEEGGAADYFHAQTRRGDDSRSVLLLHDPALIDVLQAERPPGREIMRRLFLQEVKIPGWWLEELQNPDGTPAGFPGPRWLRDRLVFMLHEGQWRGRKKGRPVILRDDEKQGIRLIGEETDADL